MWYKLDIDTAEDYFVCRSGLLKSSSGKIYGNKSGKSQYITVNLKMKDGTIWGTVLHRLIAYTFKPNQHNKPFVNHKDGNKHNNRAKNLEWCTYSENTRHAYKTGLIGSNSKGISKEKAYEVLNLRKEGYTPTEISCLTGIRLNIVTYVTTGRIFNRRDFKQAS